MKSIPRSRRNSSGLQMQFPCTLGGGPVEPSPIRLGSKAALHRPAPSGEHHLVDVPDRMLNRATACWVGAVKVTGQAKEGTPPATNVAG